MTRPDGSCPGILVVDDDSDIRESLRQVLEDEGYAVACVKDGAEALDYLRQGNRPCLILLDLTMPGMDGRQFRRQQRNDPAIAHIPLVVITATGQRPVMVDADELIMKPLDLGPLLDVIQRHC